MYSSLEVSSEMKNSIGQSIDGSLATKVSFRLYLNRDVTILTYVQIGIKIVFIDYSYVFPIFLRTQLYNIEKTQNITTFYPFHSWRPQIAHFRLWQGFEILVLREMTNDGLRHPIDKRRGGKLDNYSCHSER